MTGLNRVAVSVACKQPHGPPRAPPANMARAGRLPLSSLVSNPPNSRFALVEYA